MPDISALNSEEKVIMVQESGRNTYKVGDSIRIMGVTANDSNFGIGKVADHTFTVGATLTLNNLSDKTLRCLIDFRLSGKRKQRMFPANHCRRCGFFGLFRSGIQQRLFIDRY